ncbi:MAG: hypothetical protein B6229_02110 [Spirochaetaceae bacterium 4572_7]|nr:MAG: hypothetical protein B6229_02110 [Spirochaetaceae bacterium 4572_7]
MNKKDEMLEVALKLFSSIGYENTGIQKIVDGAGVKKPTLYHYFGSKQGLLVALLDEYFNPFITNLKQSSIYEGDLVLTLEQVVNVYFNFATEHAGFYRFFLNLMYSAEDSDARRSVHSYVDRLFQIIQQVFKDSENDHGNMRGRSRRYAMTLTHI